MAVFTDYFDGPADQYLENRPGWSKAGLIDGAARLTGDGKIRCATADSGGGAYYREMGTPDHWVEAPVYTSVSNGFPVAIRIVDTSNYWGYRYTGTTHQLWRNVAGTFTQLDTSTDPFVPGDLIKMEAIGNDIRVYRNGVEILSINSASHNTATKAGLVARSTVVNPMTGQISVGFSTNTPDIRYNNEAPDIRYPFGPEDFRYPESFDGDFRIPGGDPDIRYYEGVVPQVNITGTVAVTFANFTSAATGTGQTTVTGTAANTFGNFTSAATGHKGTAWFVDSAVGTSGAGTSWATA